MTAKASLMTARTIQASHDAGALPLALRATHVVAGLEAAHGGPSYSVPRLCQALRAQGVDTELLSAFDNKQPDLDPLTASFTNLYREDFSATPIIAKWRLSSQLNKALSQSAARSDIVHNHGLWLAPNIHAGHAARRAGCALVVSPRGMLAHAALAFSRRRKAIVWKLLQEPALRQAACWHATSEAEACEIQAAGVTAPIAVIPNGIDIPDPDTDVQTQRSATILYVGRLHAKKNLACLIKAWSELEAAFPNWRLRIVGPDEAPCASELRSLAASLQLRRVTIEAAAYGQGKIELMRQASIFVLPSLNENFGLTVAEALGCGLPVIATKGTPWSGLVAHGCGLWIDHGVSPLIEALRALLALPDNVRAEMGARGRLWVGEAFAWSSVGDRMARVYAWLAGRSERPDCVQL